MTSPSSKDSSPYLTIFLDEAFEKYLIKFMNSPRNIENPAININNYTNE
jgi:hypothetical protein